MPKEMEMMLKKKAAKVEMSKERTGAYIFGTMRAKGWKPSREIKRKAAKQLLKKSK